MNASDTMLRRICAVLIPLPFFVLTGHRAQGQSNQSVLSGRPACSACRLDLDHVATIGERTGNGMVENDRSWLVRDSRARYYLLYAYATSISVFDSSGRFLKQLGRKGGGPGELEGVSGVRFSAGDSIHVFDWGLSRRVVFTPDLEYARSGPLNLQPQPRWDLLPDGRAVVNLDIRSPDRIGQPLHLVNTEGMLVRSFGSQTGLYRADVPGLTVRALAIRDASTLWVARQYRYLLELFDVNSGQQLAALVRRAAWFPDNERPRSQRGESATEPPAARIGGLHYDDRGFLWVLSVVPDRRWRSAVRSGEPGHITITDNDTYYDWVIEVIDPARKELVHSVRFDSRPPWHVGHGFAAKFEDSDYPVFKVYRMRLVGR